MTTLVAPIECSLAGAVALAAAGDEAAFARIIQGHHDDMTRVCFVICGDIWDLWIIDVDGLRMVLLANHFPATSEENKAELREMIESIQFVP